MAMNCETFRQKIDAYMDGGLMLDEKYEMELHAAECEECALMLSCAQDISTLCTELGSEVCVPLSAQAAWRRAVRAEAKKARPVNAWARSLGTIAAALLVVVMGTQGMRMNNRLPADGQTGAEAVTAASYMQTVSTIEEIGYWSRMPVAGLQTRGGGLHSDGSLGDAPVENEDADQADSASIVLRSAARSIHSDHYDLDVQWMEDLVSEYGAYFEERSETAAVEGGEVGRVIEAVVRVPHDRLDDFLTELDQLGSTVLKSEKAEDVTGRYLDAQSRLAALKMQKTKLEELLAAAAEVEELIVIDDKMTEVIAAMEALEGDIRRWESRQSYCTVSIRLTEVFEKQMAPTASLGERMKNGFDEGAAWLGEFGQDALVMLAAFTPKMVVWVPAAALVIILIGVIVKKYKK